MGVNGRNSNSFVLVLCIVQLCVCVCACIFIFVCVRVFFTTHSSLRTWPGNSLGWHSAPRRAKCWCCPGGSGPSLWWLSSVQERGRTHHPSPTLGSAIIYSSTISECVLCLWQRCGPCIEPGLLMFTYVMTFGC